MINRVFSVGLVGLLMLVSAMAQNEAYIVTDLKGVPELVEGKNRRAIRLLGKISEGKLDVSEDETLTLTRLSDGERFILSGPIVVNFDPTQFSRVSGDGSVKKIKGRLTSTQELRKVSSTMGATSVRIDEPVLLTRGPVLRPQLAWIPSKFYPDCRVTLSRNGEVIGEWQKLEGNYNSESPLQTPTIVSLADLSLQAEEPYFISFTPLGTDSQGNLTVDEDHKVETDFKLVNEAMVQKAEQEESLARELYSQNPSDLTPLTSYLAFLWHNGLLCDAIQLVQEPAFNEQGGTRTILLTELKNGH